MYLALIFSNVLKAINNVNCFRFIHIMKMGKRGKRSVGGTGMGLNLRALNPSVFGGVPIRMKENQLPLVEDVGLHMEKLELEGVNRSEAIRQTAEKIESIYQQASIPCLNHRSIERKVKRLLDLKRGKEMVDRVDKRSGKLKDQGKFRRKKGNNKLKQKLDDVLGEIFDVKTDVPEIERDFYEDQCSDRRMIIGSLDLKETKKREVSILKAAAAQKNKREHEEATEKRRRKEKEHHEMIFKKVKWSEVEGDLTEEVMQEEESEEVEESRDGEVRLGNRSEMWSTSGGKRRRMSGEDESFLGDLLETCDRFSVSETAASTIYNLHTSASNVDHKVNQSQVQKLKRKLRLKKVEEFKPENEPEAIGFDERRDDSKTVVGVGHKGRKRFETSKEEHCAVILYPGDQYAGHVVPKSGTGPGLARELEQFIKERKISMEQVKSFVTDGCEKMVGWKGGVHASLEKIFKVPFGRIICFFHHLEKSFEVILLLYSGNTTSPGSYSSGVGKEVKEEVHKLPVKSFRVLPNASLLTLIDSTSEEVFKQLSNDHKIFLRLVRVVITGEVEEQYVSMKIGPVVQSRFTTTQARCIRRWISEEQPSFELSRVVNYLIYVWAEVFLLGKRKNSLVMAPRMLLLEVMLTKKHCSNPEKTLLKSSISHNGQMAHPENVLLAMLASPTLLERKKAVDIIFGIRERGPLHWESPSGVRPFKVFYLVQLFL